MVMSSARAPFGPADWKCINTIRCLAIDMVQAANSGHPGAPMGMAPFAHVLFSRFLRCHPANPLWMGRDRFVLSNGHACALQYALLHLLGYPGVEELRSFRQLDSRLPGHPESHLTPGIEVTTGPLGQGVANGVGLALAEAHLAETFNRPDSRLVDNYTYVFLGDGCQMEGIASEAASLAGHLRLGKLIMIYDDNRISIDGSTDLAFTEDVTKRFEAYGFHCQSVCGDSDLEAMAGAIEGAQAVKDRPSLIRLRTTIGYGSRQAGTEKVHGAPLGAEDVAAAKTALAMDPQQSFHVPEEVRAHYQAVAERGRQLAAAWEELLRAYSRAYPQEAEELMRRLAKRLPDDLASLLPRYRPSDPPQATRKLSEGVLNAVAPHMPELIGGSADLTHSNLTRWKGAVDLQAPDTGMGSYRGRYIRYGVREHAMFGISNGLAAYGALIPFASTFLNFISYGLGSVRLSALSHLRVLYIMTHDSIGLGEDGPTHQPIETLAGLRALPNLIVLRPADGNEVSGAYWVALCALDRPAVLCLSRQNVPQLRGSSLEGVARGAYALGGGDDGPLPAAQAVLVATGTEVSLAVAAADLLAKEDIPVRVISMPSWELFQEQSPEYQRSVFPSGLPVVAIEALATLGWERWAHVCVGMRSFGSSGPYQAVYAKYGFTGEAIAERVRQTLTYYHSHPLPDLLSRP